MAFVHVRAASEVWLRTAGGAEADPLDAGRAAAQLRVDYERWSRWVAGMVGFFVTIVGAFVLAGFGYALVASGSPPLPVDVVVLALSAGATLAGGSLLIRLWRSGRRLSRGAAWWLALPYRAGTASPDASGWVRARSVNLEPRLLVRIISSTLALLGGLLGLASVGYGVAEGVAPAGVGVVAVSAIALLCAIGQLGGILRIVSGLAAGDPFWRRISR